MDKDTFCHFCGLKEGQVVRINGGGKVIVRLSQTKQGDTICGWCRMKLRRNLK